MSEMNTKEVAKIIQERDLSATDQFKIEGPWAFKGADGLETPVYIFLPGGEKKEIGKAVVKIGGSMKFTIELQDEYKDHDLASFEVPMRFTVRQKKIETLN